MNVMGGSRVKAIRSLGIYVNTQKQAQAAPVVRRLVEVGLGLGMQVRLEPWLGQALDLDHLAAADFAAEVDALAVFGGDGTLLRAMPFALAHGIPLLGINLGHIGFLTEVEPNALEDALGRLWEGDYRVEARMLLSVTGPEGQALLALNDAVISRGSYGRLIRIEAYEGETLIERYHADGLIIATPTGSTAYSLSAGGPVVSPDMQCFILAPICPHSLHTRPVVIPATGCLRLQLTTQPNAGDMLLTIDGQQTSALCHQQQVTIQRAAQDACFIRLAPYRFYDLLRTKLNAL